MPIRWTVSVALNIGGRQKQEDGVVAFRSADGSSALGVLADGLGGHGDGDLASGLVVAMAQDFWNEISGNAGRDGAALLGGFVEAANAAVVALQRERDTAARTTVCCALARHGEVDIASVGDSRAYLFSQGAVTRLTRDHSVTEMLLATGAISEDGMRAHPDSSRLTQSLGSEAAPRPFTVRRTVRRGEAILLCSDGLWQALSSARIGDRLAGGGPEGRVASLVGEAAKAAGAESDNVSAALLETGPEASGILAGLGRLLARRQQHRRAQ